MSNVADVTGFFQHITRRGLGFHHEREKVGARYGVYPLATLIIKVHGDSAYDLLCNHLCCPGHKSQRLVYDVYTLGDTSSGLKFSKSTDFVIRPRVLLEA